MTSTSQAQQGGGEHLSLTGIADKVAAAAQGQRVSVEDIVQCIGPRSVLPLLLIPALTAATPLSGIPGLSMMCGLLIALISAEMLLRFDHVWLPARLMRQNVEGQRVRDMMHKIRPWLAWLDRHTHDRLTVLFHRPLIFVPQIFCVLSGLVMPFLEFIPFSSSIVATGVCFLALSLLTRDGLFFIFALCAYAGLGALLWQVLA